MEPLPNLLFVLILGVLTGYLTFLTTKGGLTDNRFGVLWKKLTYRGWLVFFVLFAILILLIGQEVNNNRLNNQNALALRKERDHRDSIVTTGIKLGVDSNRKKLFEDLSKAFAKQELRLDTVENSLAIMRDSAKVTINNYSTGDPVIILDKKGIFPKSDSGGSYGVSFKSIDEGSTNFHIVCYVLTEKEGGFDVSKMNLFPNALRLAKNAVWNTGFGSPSSPAAKSIYLYMLGTYTNLDGTKSYKIDDVYKYSSATNSVSLLQNEERKKALKIIKSVPEQILRLQNE